MTTLIGYVQATTPKSILFIDHYWHAPEWLPLSQLDMIPGEESSEVHVHLSAFIVRVKEIREFEERKNAEGG